jgi:membrane protein
MAGFDLPIGWGELGKRTIKESVADDCLGLAAQLAYYLFLALFPAILFLLALGSFFPLRDLAGDITRLLQPIASRDIIQIFEDQIRRISDSQDGGLLTFGVLAALWSSSAAMVSGVSALNAAYDVEEGRPWWKVRLIAMGLTLALAVFFLLSFTLVLAGPTIAEYMGQTLHMGAVVEWTWKILQWPIAFAFVSLAIALVYYFAPDVEQDWSWITPGALLATLLWLVASLAFKIYVTNFSDYNATYGAIGGVMVLLLWFYVSSLAILIGAEMNAEIEHASPHGKAPGEKVPGQKRMIGARAARAWREGLAKARGARTPHPTSAPTTAASGPDTPAPASAPIAGQASSVPGMMMAAALVARVWRRPRSRTTQRS